MNIALILAGGKDPSFQMEIPKQFVNVFNRPIIVYTLETFQRHPEIDGIMVACIPGWESMVEAYAKQFDITKLIGVIPGGSNGQETSRLGAEKLMETYHTDDNVIIHDAIRPLVTDEIISDSIFACKKTGMGIASVGSMDNIMMTQDGRFGEKIIPRYAFKRIQTPQTYQLGLLMNAHQQAIEQSITGEIDTNNMIARLGKKVCFSKGSDLNIKINTVEDVEMFKALYRMIHETE